MNKNEIPMVPCRKSSLPVIYGDTPSFLGCPVVYNKIGDDKYDVIVAGVPWEGTITWGTYSGCELSPRSIRQAAARYGGFLPEYNLDLFDYLTLGDYGDIPMNPNDAEDSMNIIFKAMDKIYKNNSIPFVLGGDHSITPEIVRALSENADGDIGVIHLDSHLDNSKSFGNDKYPRCGPLYRIAQIEKVRNESIVHFGIRGPRNSKAQFEYAKQIGATIISINQIRDEGIDVCINKALEIAKKNTKYLFVTICSDIIDAAFNPGGPPDFNGLFPHELFKALYKFGESGLSGLDFVEIYPLNDPKSFSSHLAVYTMINALVGMASKKRSSVV